MAKTRLIATVKTDKQNIDISVLDSDFILDGENFISIREFDKEKDAKDYLKDKAKKHNDKDENGSPEKLNKMNQDIENGSVDIGDIKINIIQGNQ